MCTWEQGEQGRFLKLLETIQINQDRSIRRGTWPHSEPAMTALPSGATCTLSRAPVRCGPCSFEQERECTRLSHSATWGAQEKVLGKVTNPFWRLRLR